MFANVSNPVRVHFLHSFNSSKSQSNRWATFPPIVFLFVASSLRRFVPLSLFVALFPRALPLIHVHRSHVHTMCARVDHDLRRRVKTHRLAVEQRAAEHRRVMSFDPR